VLAQLLTRGGDFVTTATTVAEALAAFAVEEFDAVISDVGLPDGSGVDLMREICRLRPIPGIALSGYGMEQDVRRSRDAGFCAHLVKPVNLAELRLVIEQCVVGA
jgi:CheY-like chemotaxis protein